MTLEGSFDIVKVFVSRREELIMPMECLAMRCKLPLARLLNIFTYAGACCNDGERISIEDALGLMAWNGEVEEAEQYRKQQAFKKSYKLISMVQDNCALEGRCVDKETFMETVKETGQNILDDPYALWTPL